MARLLAVVLMCSALLILAALAVEYNHLLYMARFKGSTRRFNSPDVFLYSWRIKARQGALKREIEKPRPE